MNRCKATLDPIFLCGSAALREPFVTSDEKSSRAKAQSRKVFQNQEIPIFWQNSILVMAISLE
ncbi:MAG: hypothetical protein WCO57_03470 [Verrucomicrobiota bacterium]